VSEVELAPQPNPDRAGVQPLDRHPESLHFPTSPSQDVPKMTIPSNDTFKHAPFGSPVRAVWLP
jgi:hypothetical protein